MHHVDTCEPVRPSSIIAKFHADHKAARRRIEAAAINRQETVAKIVDVIQADLIEKEWVQQQKAQWFSIVAEIGPPKVDDIIKAVCKHFSVTKLDLLSHRRTRRVTRPRQVGYYLTKMLTKHSLPEIGRRFGNRDHTSALAGIRRIEGLRKSDVQMNADVIAIAVSLGETLA